MARIVPARVGARRVVAAEVLDAKDRAAAIIAHARAEADDIRKAAHVDGFAQGRAEALLGHLDALQAREHAVVEAEDAVLQVALAAAEKLLQRALEVEPERILDVVRPLLATVRYAERITLHAHPDDGPALERWLEAALDASLPAASVRLQLDPELTRGGCIVNTNRGTLDARIEVQIAALSRALERAR